MSFPTKEGKYLTIWFKIQFISIVNWVLYYKQSKKKIKIQNTLLHTRCFFHTSTTVAPLMSPSRAKTLRCNSPATGPPLTRLLKGTQDWCRRQDPWERWEQHAISNSVQDRRLMPLPESFCHLIMLIHFRLVFFFIYATELILSRTDSWIPVNGTQSFVPS